MKVLKNIVSFVVWTLLALYIILILLLRVPTVQSYIGNQAASILSSTLGTEVSIGRVDFGFLNRLIIDDVYISDQQKEMLMKATRLSVRLDVMPLTEGKVSISSAQVFGAHFNIYQTTQDAAHNFQFVLDSLASKDDTDNKPLNLRINSLIVRHSSLDYNKRYVPKKPNTFDLSHLKINNISAHAILKAFTDDSINVNLKKLSFTERSGLDVRNFGFKLEAGAKQAVLENFVLKLPFSVLAIPDVRASYQLHDKKLIDGSLTYSGAVQDSHVTLADFSFLLPSLSSFRNPTSVAMNFNGTDSKLEVPALDITDKDFDIQVNGWLKKDAWRIRFEKSLFSTDFIAKLTDAMGANGSDILPKLGTIDLTGEAASSEKGMMALGIINTAPGKVSFDYKMSPEDDFTCSVVTDGVNLGKLFDDEKLGNIVTNAEISGNKNGKKNIKGSISKIEYNNYAYSNIQIEGSLQEKSVEGAISIDDPNLRLALEGELKQQAKPAIKIYGSVRRFSPQELHLSDKWEDARFSADIDADFEASTLNDAIGSLDINDFLMESDDGNYQISNLYVKSGYNEGEHFLKLTSDFGEADLKGTFEYDNIAQSITNFIGSKLPTLPGLPSISHQVRNNFTLDLHLRDTEWMSRLLGIPLYLERPLLLEAEVNDNEQSVNINGKLPAFTYNGNQYKDGRIYIYSPGDSLKCDANLSQLQNNGLMNLSVQAVAANNNINASLHWDNQKRKERMSGEINAVAQLYNNEIGKPEAQIHIQPSHVIVWDTPWEIIPSNIIYSEDNLVVDHFAIENNRQHLIIDGIASKRSSDTLLVDMHELEVSYILDLVNFHAVEFSGEATGRAYVTSAFDAPSADGNIRVDHFKFERGRMGTLLANVEWNKDEKQIDIRAIANDGPEAQTYINGFVSPTKDFIDLDIRAEGTYIDFMHNFTESFLSDITGNALGRLRLAGPLDNINLTGQLVVDGEATVTALNTTYQLRQDTVDFIPDDILLRNMPIYDRYNNQAFLSGGIHHQHLTRLTFDLFVAADDLLAYDFREFGDNTFYGTVFASGNVDIHGRPGEVTINANVTPEENTVFTYDAANPDAISNQEFIVWGDGTNKTTPTAEERKTANLASDTPDPNRTDIFLNFLINTNPNATVRLLMDSKTGDYITLQGDGIIRASYHNKGVFQMFGTYNVRQGTYGITIQDIIKKNFVFKDGGTIIFGGNPFDAALSLQAQYTVNGVSLSDLSIGNSFSSNTIRVNCLMNIGGQAKAPRVTFDMEMPTVNADEQQMVRSVINGQEEMNQQVLYLLGIGRFYNQGTNNADIEQTDQTQLAMQSFLSGTLSTQINSLLSQVIKNDDWNFGANISTGNEGWHNAEYEGIINGRMLNNRLLINGQFGYRDNATQASPSFIGDFDIRYLLYPNGNLSLKVYNQTNDRYFTRSSLNTQGIGIIMKKDFNGLKDLFSNKKAEKKR